MCIRDRLYRGGSTPALNDVVYADLPTSLSKLIYIYLDLKINGNFDLLNIEVPIAAEDDLLGTLFEVYVVNESHRYIRNLNYMLDTEMVYLRPVRDNITLTSTIITNRKAALSETPSNVSEFWVFWNGDLQANTHFGIDTTGIDMTGVTAVISWEEGYFDFSENDMLIVDYHTEVADG